jgi:predicted transglutaminase-like cysteine proteinase
MLWRCTWKSFTLDKDRQCSNAAAAENQDFGLRALQSRPFLPLCGSRLLPAAIVACILGLTAILLCAKDNFTLDAAILDIAESRFGADARRRLIEWQRFVRDDDSASDQQKLERVNTFFNKLDFVSDQIHWGERDYWATPIEFLASDGGDCEDFAVAKYFTLRLLGVAEEKMNITYVKAWKLNQAHMVLTYYERGDAVPLVLDNLVNAIEPATRRTDLVPIYSFNGTGLWLAKERGKGNLVGGSNRLKLWNDLLTRMPTNLKEAGR